MGWCAHVEVARVLLAVRRVEKLLRTRWRHHSAGRAVAQGRQQHADKRQRAGIPDTRHMSTPASPPAPLCSRRLPQALAVSPSLNAHLELFSGRQSWAKDSGSVFPRGKVLRVCILPPPHHKLDTNNWQERLRRVCVAVRQGRQGRRPARREQAGTPWDRAACHMVSAHLSRLQA